MPKIDLQKIEMDVNKRSAETKYVTLMNAAVVTASKVLETWDKPVKKAHAEMLVIKAEVDNLIERKKEASQATIELILNPQIEEANERLNKANLALEKAQAEFDKIKNFDPKDKENISAFDKKEASNFGTKARGITNNLPNYLAQLKKELNKDKDEILQGIPEKIELDIQSQIKQSTELMSSFKEKFDKISPAAGTHLFANIPSAQQFIDKAELIERALDPATSLLQIKTDVVTRLTALELEVRQEMQTEKETKGISSATQNKYNEIVAALKIVDLAQRKYEALDNEKTNHPKSKNIKLMDQQLREDYLNALNPVLKHFQGVESMKDSRASILWKRADSSSSTRAHHARASISIAPEGRNAAPSTEQRASISQTDTKSAPSSTQRPSIPSIPINLMEKIKAMQDKYSNMAVLANDTKAEVSTAIPAPPIRKDSQLDLIAEETNKSNLQPGITTGPSR